MKNDTLQTNPSPEVARAAKAIADAHNILLLSHAKMDGDTLGSALAMRELLEAKGKRVTVACADPAPEALRFLPGAGEYVQEASGNALVISVPLAGATARRIQWKTEGDTLRIFLTPGTGAFQPTDVSAAAEEDFDLIITLDVAEPKQLGSLLDTSPDLLTSAPLINIDHHRTNPSFGTAANIVDASAASTTQVLFQALPELFGDDWRELVTADVATLLLAGLITDTGSFQNANTTPQSLEVAAELVEMGARQQEIIRKLFKTRSLSALRLWGAALSKLRVDDSRRLMWSTITLNDLEEAGATEDDTEGLIDELLSGAPGVEMVLLFKERQDGTTALSARSTTPQCDCAEFAEGFGGGGHAAAAGVKLKNGQPFEVNVGELLAGARKFQAFRLGIDESAEQPPEQSEQSEQPEQPPAPEKPKEEAPAPLPSSAEETPLPFVPPADVATPAADNQDKATEQAAAPTTDEPDEEGSSVPDALAAQEKEEENTEINEENNEAAAAEPAPESALEQQSAAPAEEPKKDAAGPTVPVSAPVPEPDEPAPKQMQQQEKSSNTTPQAAETASPAPKAEEATTAQPTTAPKIEESEASAAAKDPENQSAQQQPSTTNEESPAKSNEEAAPPAQPEESAPEAVPAAAPAPDMSSEEFSDMLEKMMAPPAKHLESTPIPPNTDAK